METATPETSTPCGSDPSIRATSAERPLLSLVLPVRDEAALLPAALLAITRWMSDARMRVEVIVVDDGSADGTRATAAAFHRRIHGLRVLRHVEGRGELEAVRTAERAARGAVIAFGRVTDFACALEAGPELFETLMNGADVAFVPAARRLTPVPETDTGGLTRSCREWLRRALPRGRDARRPVFLACRATALRRMLGAHAPSDGVREPDWTELARRARCDLRAVRTGSHSSR